MRKLPMSVWLLSWWWMEDCPSPRPDLRTLSIWISSPLSESSTISSQNTNIWAKLQIKTRSLKSMLCAVLFSDLFSEEDPMVVNNFFELIMNFVIHFEALTIIGSLSRCIRLLKQVKIRSERKHRSYGNILSCAF